MGNAEKKNSGSQDREWVGPVVALTALTLAIGTVVKNYDSSDFSGAESVSSGKELREPRSETRARARGFFRQLSGPEEDTGAAEELIDAEDQVTLVDEEGRPQNVYLALRKCLESERDIGFGSDFDWGQKFYSLNTATPPVVITPPMSTIAWLPANSGDNTWTVSMGNHIMDYEVPFSNAIARYERFESKKEERISASALSLICGDVKDLFKNIPHDKALCGDDIKDDDCPAYVDELEEEGRVAMETRGKIIGIQSALEDEGIEALEDDSCFSLNIDLNNDDTWELRLPLTTDADQTPDLVHWSGASSIGNEGTYMAPLYSLNEGFIENPQRFIQEFFRIQSETEEE